MKTILIYSGGLDSTVLLFKLRAEGHEVRALGVNYGQRHRKELDAATTICAKFGVEYHIADLSAIRPLLGGSSQTDDNVAVPHGHYAAETMKLTVVPNRNMIMLSVAIAWAISTKSESVNYAAHGGDHAIYPDCREEFASSLNTTALLADWHQVRIDRPFVRESKAGIVALGQGLGVPFDETWSCYEGASAHCGKCGTCVERREAFKLAGVPDPTIYT